MTLTERNAQLVGLLKEAETNAAYWTQRVQQLSGAVLLVRELLKDEEAPADKVDGAAAKKRPK